MEDDVRYLSRRARQERDAAFDCQQRKVREVHLEFAQAYEFRVHLLKKLDARNAGQLSYATDKLRREPAPSLRDDPRVTVRSETSGPRLKTILL